MSGRRGDPGAEFSPDVTSQRPVTRRLVVQLLSGLLAGHCMDATAQDISDPWYTPGKTALESSSTALAWHVDFEEAERSHIERVERALAGSAIVEVIEPLALTLASRALKAQAGHRLFLVRSLRFDAYGAYTVQRDSTSLRIHHHSLGFDAPVVRQGLIVLLADKPQAVYCTCSMAR